MKSLYGMSLGMLVLCSFLIISCDRPVAHRQAANNGAANQSIIINCQQRCEQVARLVSRAGGQITQRYQNIPLIAAKIPKSSLSVLNHATGQQRIFKDEIIAKPKPVNTLALSKIVGLKATHLTNNLITDSLTENQHLAFQASSKKPNNSTLQNDFMSFAGDNELINAAELHRNGYIGEGVIVAVIDTGTANNSEIVPSLADSIIGGENFVLLDGEPSATSTLNDEHGTWVASNIASHANVEIDRDGPLAQAVLQYSPESIIDIDETTVALPLFGSAPGAKIYAMKTFAANTDGGTASSIIIAAMDRTLTLRLNYNAGLAQTVISGDGSEDEPFVYDSLNIGVVNMSVGGAALFPGQEIEDIITDAMLEAGIVVVTSSGNEGFAAITGGSPGTSLSAISVGAISIPVHERILRDLQESPGVGAQFRPADHLQIAHFSSRGPTTDGRTGVHLVANGYATFVQGADGHLAFVSGTSFSSPSVAGAAALLRGAFPDVDANQIRLALVEAANPDIIGGQPSAFDQGHGLLDVAAAFNLLSTGELLVNHLPTELAAKINSEVEDNLENIGLRVFEADTTALEITAELAPGQVKQIYLSTEKSTHDVVIQVLNVDPELPADQQNALFGDDLFLLVLDAPTSTDHRLVRAFLTDPEEFVVTHPQQGIMRVALMGDWTNAGKISTTLRIFGLTEAQPQQKIEGIIADKEAISFFVDVPPNTLNLDLNLNWEGNWSRFPVHDIDLIAIAPDQTLLFDGATLHSPEIVNITDPAPGTWELIIEGFELHGMQDEFSLTVTNESGQSLLTNGVNATEKDLPDDDDD